MLRRKMIPLVLAGVFVLSGVSAAFAAPEHNDEQQEAAAVQSAAVSLAQAVDAAQKHTGGQAIAAGMEKTNSGFRYEVKTVTNNQVAESVIDVASGTVIANQSNRPAQRLNREQRASVAKLQSATTTLSAAIKAVEQQSGGKAFEANFEHEQGTAGFDVDVTKDGVVQKFMVEAATGKIVSLPTAQTDRDQDNEDHEDHEGHED